VGSRTHLQHLRPVQPGRRSRHGGSRRQPGSESLDRNTSWKKNDGKSEDFKLFLNLFQTKNHVSHCYFKLFPSCQFHLDFLLKTAQKPMCQPTQRGNKTPHSESQSWEETKKNFSCTHISVTVGPSWMNVLEKKGFPNPQRFESSVLLQVVARNHLVPLLKWLAPEMGG